MPRAPCALTKTEKYRKLNAIVQQITDNLINRPQAQFDTYFHEIEKCHVFIQRNELFSGK